MERPTVSLTMKEYSAYVDEWKHNFTYNL